ncbi:DUF3857 domain-containing protein [bacterium]|nr:DUF3857 domain-containing protein [bacterium]
MPSARLISLVTRFFLYFVLSARALAQLPVAPVEAAWEAWAENNRSCTEAQFQKALQNKSGQFRAHLGLAYLYQLIQRRQDSWNHYKKAIELTDDPEPYIYAGMITPRMYNLHNLKSSGVIDLYEILSDTAKNSTLRASAAEMTGRYYQEHAELKKAKYYYEKLNAITDWMVIGPFDNISASGFERVFPPETEIDSLKIYTGKNDIPAHWFPITKYRYDGWIDFRRYFPQEESVFYANTFVHSPQKQTVQIRIGTSGAVKVFLNDEQTIEWADENNNDLDTYIAETELQMGWNRLLIKCGYSEINQCNFMMRITGPGGERLDNIRIHSSVQPYPSKPGARPGVIRHFAEAFFEKRIREFPNHLENYLLLSECYLRNDKAIEAELVLRRALAIAPDNALILHQLIEAYTRGEKFDEIITTLERIHNLDPMIPAVLDYKYDQALDNQDYEEAQKILDNLERALGESPELIQYKIALYHAKNEPEKVVEITDEALIKYPDNWEFVQASAYLSLYANKSPDKAIKSLKRHLKGHTQNNVFTTLMEFYLKAGKFNDWEKIAIKRLKYSPAATGFYYDMALTYKTAQRYDEAETYLLQAIQICHQSALYWTALGELMRITGRNKQAVHYYEKALVYNPTFYDTRDKLREIQDKPPVYDQFGVVNIDSLIDNAPAAEAYPDDGAVILLNDAKRVVYPRGASESREEMLVRVFNPTGIDQFKEYWIAYNPYTEKLIVEKAIVIKPDGSEINADQNDNQLVFKTLEENDFIYLKWKIRNYYSGKLSNHFWDDFYFNTYYPVQDIRYAILAPDDFIFQYKTQFMHESPDTVIQTADGRLYQWRLKNEPAIQYEYRMPGLDDIGKKLYISSIPDWAFIVDWYTDLAKTKTRSSYEIKEKVHELIGDQILPDSEKIRRIHHFITENIRYSFIPFRQSGLIPQKARDVLVNRIGDCKDTATLAIAMLKEAGIDAHYVIVNTRNEGRRVYALPSIDFNHAIINVTTGDKPLYIDLTAQNYPVGSVPQADMGAFALNIQSGVTSPVYLDENLFMKRELKRINQSNVLKNNTLNIEITTTRTGSFAAQARQAYRFMGQKDREKTLIENLTRDYPSLELKSFTIENIDSIASDIHYYYEFTVPEYMNEAGSFKIVKIPWTDAVDPNRALSYDQRQYTYEYWPSADLEKETITLTLPEGYRPVEMPGEIHHTCSVAEYSMSLSHQNGTIKGTRTFINKKWDVLPEEYAAFKTFYNNVLKADDTQILLKAKQP